MIRPLFLATTLLIAASQTVLAQPATDAAPKAPNPPNIGPLTPEQKAKADQQIPEIMRKAQEQAMEIMKMSPQQRKETMRTMIEQGLRATLTHSGFIDLKLQDRIVAFVAEQEESRKKVRETAGKVHLALERRGVPTDEKGMSLLLIN